MKKINSWEKNKGQVSVMTLNVKFCVNKIDLSPLIAFLLTVPRQFLCYSSSLFVHW